MENIDELQPPVDSPSVEKGGDGMVVPPSIDLSAQDGATGAERGSTEVVVPPVDAGAEERGEDEAEKGGELVSDDGGDRSVADGGNGGTGLNPATQTSVAGGGDGERVGERVEEREEERVEIQDLGGESCSGEEDAVDGDRVESSRGEARTGLPRWRIVQRVGQRSGGDNRGKAVLVGGESST